jgi:hypothetical protein
MAAAGIGFLQKGRSGMSSIETAQTSHQELSARLQIKEAMDKYALGIDLRDPERFLGAWHEDAVFDVDHPPQICTGHSEILGWAESVWQLFDVLNHFTMNHIIDFEGDDKASGVGHAAAMFVMADGAYVTAAAIYYDKYEMRDGVWRMTYRKVDVNHLSEHPQAVTTVRPAGTAAQG